MFITHYPILNSVAAIARTALEIKSISVRISFSGRINFKKKLNKGKHTKTTILKEYFIKSKSTPGSANIVSVSR